MKSSRPIEVFEGLRREILTGVLPPGHKLPFAGLCARYGVSVGVAREALQRLAEQRLVVGELGCGFRVIDVSPAELIELTEARCLVEPFVLEQSIAHGDLSWESRMVAAHHILDNTPVFTESGGISPAWSAAHADFHGAMAEGCTNRHLVAIVSSLRDSAEVYRQWSMPLSEPIRRRGAAKEHAQLLEALLARDSETAVQLLIDHIRRTTDHLLSERYSVDQTSGDVQRVHSATH